MSSKRPFAGGRRGQEKRDTLRARLFAEQEGRCVWCGREMTLDRPRPSKIGKNFATFDHIIRLADGGRRNDRRNIRLACRVCNNERHV